MTGSWPRRDIIAAPGRSCRLASSSMLRAASPPGRVGTVVERSNPETASPPHPPLLP